MKEQDEKINVTFLTLISKRNRCAWCIYSINRSNIVWLMHFQVETADKKVFREKLTTGEVPLMFSDVKVFTER